MLKVAADPRMSRVQMHVDLGGVAAAREALSDTPTPNLVIIEMGLPSQSVYARFYDYMYAIFVDPINLEFLYKPKSTMADFVRDRENAFKKKLNFYGVKQFRNFEIEKNAPYFRVMMKRFFYYYKPTLRWERTMRVATMRKARRKGSRIPRKLNINRETKALALASNKNELNNENLNRNMNPSLISEESNLLKLSKIQKPTHFYSLVSKRAGRYRYEIYKDVLQHWYYKIGRAHV
jgi:hypothetical protein